MPKPLTKADLPESTHASGVFLFCRKCREHYSATRGDYVHMIDADPLLCCGRSLVLARKATTIEEVQLRQLHSTAVRQ